MATALVLDEFVAVELARECIYRFLASLLVDPTRENRGYGRSRGEAILLSQAGQLLREEAMLQDVAIGLGELPVESFDLNPLLTQYARQPVDNPAEYDRIFGLVVAKECPPYETEYYPAGETFQRSQQLADIAGFYLAFGLQPSSSSPERPDHLALELEFMAHLLMKARLAISGEDRPGIGSDGNASGPEERAMICEDAAHKFFQDHLAWWVPAFAKGLAHKAGGGIYATLARTLAAWIPIERARMSIPSPRHPVQAVLIERPEEQGGCEGCAGR